MSRIDELRKLATVPSVDWVERLDEHIRGVMDTMEAIHGGDYRFVVNHDVCMVMIMRVLRT